MRKAEITQYLALKVKYKDMCEEIICLLMERGHIKAIEVQEDGIEFWIVNTDEECYMFKLFPYDWGVIIV